MDREHFSIVTSHTRAAIWSGKFIAAVIAQVLVYNDWMDYRELNFLSLGGKFTLRVSISNLNLLHTFSPYSTNMCDSLGFVFALSED